MNRRIKPLIVGYDVCCLASLVGLPLIFWWCSFTEQFWWYLVIAGGLWGVMGEAEIMSRYQRGYQYYHIAVLLRNVVLGLTLILAVVAILLRLWRFLHS